jgi:hypothetical protein
MIHYWTTTCKSWALACRQSPSRRHYSCAKITALGLISLGTSYTSDYRVFSSCLDSLTAADSTFAFYLLHPAQRPAPERCVAPGLVQAAFDGATHRFGRRGRVLRRPMVTFENSRLISFMSPISGFWLATTVRYCSTVIYITNKTSEGLRAVPVFRHM